MLLYFGWLFYKTFVDYNALIKEEKTNDQQISGNIQTEKGFQQKIQLRINIQQFFQRNWWKITLRRGLTKETLF